MLERDRRPQLISVSDVVGVDGLPRPLPRSEYVFAAVWAEGADIAAVYGASSSRSKELFIADFEAVFYHGGFFADLATRLKELAKACRAQEGRVFAPGALIRHIEPHGVRAIEIPPWFEPAETLLFAAACIKSGWVKFCPPTIDKMAIHPLGAALSFKADDPVEAALQGAFLAAISLKFDHQLSSKPKRRAWVNAQHALAAWFVAPAASIRAPVTKHARPSRQPMDRLGSWPRATDKGARFGPSSTVRLDD